MRILALSLPSNFAAVMRQQFDGSTLVSLAMTGAPDRKVQRLPGEIGMLVSADDRDPLGTLATQLRALADALDGVHPNHRTLDQHRKSVESEKNKPSAFRAPKRAADMPELAR